MILDEDFEDYYRAFDKVKYAVKCKSFQELMADVSLHKEYPILFKYPLETKLLMDGGLDRD